MNFENLSRRQFIKKTTVLAIAMSTTITVGLASTTSGSTNVTQCGFPEVQQECTPYVVNNETKGYKCNVKCADGKFYDAWCPGQWDSGVATYGVAYCNS